MINLNACNSCLTPFMLRAIAGGDVDTVRFEGHEAQHAAYDALMLIIADQALPKELNEDAARRFGLYPSRFDTIETDDMTFIRSVRDGEVVGVIRNLAVPVAYYR